VRPGERREVYQRQRERERERGYLQAEESHQKSLGGELAPKKLFQGEGEGDGEEKEGEIEREGRREEEEEKKSKRTERLCFETVILPSVSGSKAANYFL